MVTFIFEFEFELVVEIEFEFEIEFGIELEFEFVFELKFGLKEPTSCAPISIHTGVQFALKDPLDRSPEPPQSPTGECAQRHPRETRKSTTLSN